MNDSMFDTHEDGTLRCTLSSKTGEGSASMKNYVQQHVMSILLPINEHIRELQQRTQQMLDYIDVAAARELEFQNSVNQGVKAWLAHRDGQVEKIHEDIESLRATHKEAGQEYTALLNDHSRTVSLLSDTCARVGDTETSILELKRNVTNINGRLSDETMRLDATSGIVKNLNELMVEFKQSHSALQNRHADLAKCHAHTTQNCEDAHERMAGLEARFETQKKEVSHAVVGLNDRAFDIEKHVLELQDQVDGLSSASQRLDGHVQSLLTDIGYVERTLEQAIEANATTTNATQDKIAAAAARIQSTAERLVNIEKSISSVQQDVADEAEVGRQSRSEIQELQRQVGKNSNTINRNTAVIYKIDETQQQIAAHVEKIDSHAELLEQQGEKLGHRTNVLDDGMTKLASFRDDAAIKLDMQALELETNRANHEELRHGLGQTNSALKDLTVDFAATSDHIDNVTSRLDLAHEYLDGLGKGLQDAHRHSLSGTGGMLLPARHAQSKRMLPGISGKTGVIASHKSVS